MSFRSRLTLFFVAIVIVPMASMAVVLFHLLADNEAGKSDARLAAHEQVARGLQTSSTLAARTDAVRIAKNDRVLGAAIRAADGAAVQARLTELRRIHALARIAVYATNGSTLGDSGTATAIFPATITLNGTGGGALGRLQVSTTTAGHYVSLVGTLANTSQHGGVRSVVSSNNAVISSDIAGVAPRRLPVTQGHVTIRGTRYRVTTFPAPGFNRAQLRLSLLDPTRTTSASIRHSRALAAGILAGFFILAFLFALLVSRSLQRQIGGFLEAARKIGAGDFSVAVPTVGHDEFAALGDQFNLMAQQLEARQEQLSTQQERLEISMRRIGETFASNLDSDALLDIVVHAAKDGVGAVGGRARVRSDDGTLREVVTAGALDGLLEIVLVAEAEVLSSGQPQSANTEAGYALAHPLRAQADDFLFGGVISVARHEAFTADERDLFNYLAGQVSVSLENVDLHETVERQAVTDELTGLSNRRRFQEAIAGEVERARRFEQGVGLLMMDIDDFKRVNDEHGHQQGDLVLREVARVVRECSREIDEPARYGGEELAMVVPGADLEGGFRLGERIRRQIEELEIPLLGRGNGKPLHVTVSIGVAAQRGTAADMRELVASADAALYDAKRSGKNKTVRAG